MNIFIFIPLFDTSRLLIHMSVGSSKVIDDVNIKFISILIRLKALIHDVSIFVENFDEDTGATISLPW